jgi:antirestriction protein ArdC
MAEEQKKMYELVADKIIKQLKEGVAPWQKPWNSAGTDYSMPYNAVTGKPYKGLNSLYLHLFSPHSDPRFATFKQAQAEGWQVQKGAKGLMINFVKTHDLRKKLDDKGKPILDEKGMPVMINVKYNNPIITKAWIFNAEQIKGIPPLPAREINDTQLWQKLERAESIVKNSGAIIEHNVGGEAYYSPLFDKVSMPDRKQFETADRYYSTLLHEIGHWTGHHSRLDRDLVNKFGTPDYAREELRAEIASMMLGHELSIGHDPKQHLAYVQSWIKILTDTPYEIHSASADAQRISDFVLGFEKKQELKIEVVPEKDLNPNTLNVGEEIKYNSTTYKVLNADKKDFLIENISNSHKVQLTTKDKLFSSLVEAKNNPIKEEISKFTEKEKHYNTSTEAEVQQDTTSKRKL